MDTLSPTPRTTVNRGKNRAVADRAELHAVLADALLAHLGVIAGAHPAVLPTAFGVDLDGPDAGGSLYLHGSVAAGWLNKALEHDVCVTITELDGLVAGRSAFHHSMNYRSAVVIGRARRVEDATERERALATIVDHMIPGRWDTLRPSTRKELAATAVLAVPLAEASLKVRAGGPGDEPEDIDAGTWGGHIPLRRVAGAPVPDPDSEGKPAPADVARRAAALGAEAADLGAGAVLSG
ncbi:pyridoxamine 5'-phosphate oxidase family protein [Sinomonas sp. P47F7]|uniref:pyridoxamine 5'-phosphate oxidase family protein n=1 Tax=Sinomonas sp. P47F7 TaxID=3410987 RepID=UPI003BF56A29